MANYIQQKRVGPQVKQTPEKTADTRCYNQHEVAAANVDYPIDGRGNKKSTPWTVFNLEAALEKTTPKQFLAWTDYQGHQ